MNELLLLLVPRLDVLTLVLPEPIPNRVVVLELPTMIQFLTVLFVALFVPVPVCNHTTAPEVLVLFDVIVKLRVAADAGQMVFAVDPLLPSRVT